MKNIHIMDGKRIIDDVNHRDNQGKAGNIRYTAQEDDKQQQIELYFSVLIEDAQDFLYQSDNRISM